MKQQISSLPQVTIKELEDEFDKLKGEKAEPSRYLKSQQEKQQQISAAAAESNDNGDGKFRYNDIWYVSFNILLSTFPR